MTSAESPTVSSRFNVADADVTFKSSDSVVFHVHRKNLEVVPLSEAAVTLELLFQFMYPQRHPALDTTPFEILEPLAEAAEKYQVFPAMNICHIRLRDMVHEHPVEVAVYAAKHGYPYLLCEVAPMMISMDPVKVVEILPPQLILPWVRHSPDPVGLIIKTVQIRYVQEWTQVLQNSALVLPPGRLGIGVHSMRSLDEIFNISTATWQVEDCCQRELVVWRRQIEDGIAKIPKFSTFL
ncbi:hypothetical protein B0H13DRAFT_2241226 [Mycena leptocephala]|nr:hypothetical protein B0H13DRAFT_2241226 [Mycena leptocephala]